jgi:hypothetical protein
MGMEVLGQYTVDGDKVSMTTPDGRGIVFTRKGDTLDAGGVLGIVCQKQ